MREMKIMKRVFLLTVTLLVAFGLSGCSYNSLTAQQQGVKGAWADVESQLQRRADLIPMPGSSRISKRWRIISMPLAAR